jgi:hypothetical protein
MIFVNVVFTSCSLEPQSLGSLTSVLCHLITLTALTEADLSGGFDIGHEQIPLISAGPDGMEHKT